MMSDQSKSAIPFVIDWLENLIAPDQVFEIRGIGGRRWSGYFDYQHLREAAIEAMKLTDKQYQGEWSCHGVYWTLNPLDPSLLSRRKYKTAMIGKDEGASDIDVIHRRWMLIDCDPVRKKGISSSSDEMKASFEVICNAREELGKHFSGITEPIFSESGNGFHILYPVDLPNDEPSKILIRDILQYLAGKFDTPRARIDTQVYNAARICKLYGTMARKGDDTEDRPHRRARIFNWEEDNDNNSSD